MHFLLHDKNAIYGKPGIKTPHGRGTGIVPVLGEVAPPGSSDAIRALSVMKWDISLLSSLSLGSL